MKSFLFAVILALLSRLFMPSFGFTWGDIALCTFIGIIFFTPAIYSLSAKTVYIAGGQHTPDDSPLMFYSVQLFSAFVGALILLLPLNIGIFALQ
ncbi:hypothetical protein DRW07_11330 [Alteromonas sediminis]|uniref:Uncharacterized protein n=1 Tax=Alteromonas sediminis TaxID=2259342 RepID=A0A3N5Z7J7_9ALTE|nr:hypothetical protein [Alteromonas sediminis]RPJ66664.1 hypothetical protein DRW07_11330 [Alteromonas sediminis]